jgi:hypothetical protein
MPEGEAKVQAEAAFHYIREEPKPFLRPVENSDRAYSLVHSLMTIQGDMRRTITRGWFEYDLTCCHLAYLTKDYGPSKLRSVMRETVKNPEFSFWKQLQDELSVGAEAKPGLKNATYALGFGGGEGTIKGEIIRATNDEALAARFMDLPLIRELFEAREAKIAELIKQGEVRTIFGEPLWCGNYPAALSALAQQAQAVELKLILSLYKAMEESNGGFLVVLYQYDGVTVDFERGEKGRRKWQPFLEYVVAQRAAELGLFTRLACSA